MAIRCQRHRRSLRMVAHGAAVTKITFAIKRVRARSIKESATKTVASNGRKHRLRSHWTGCFAFGSAIRKMSPDH